MRKRILPMCLAGIATLAPCLGWGADGHRLIGEAAMQSLSPALPAFLRSPTARDTIGYLAPEPDRQKGAGETRDKDQDPAHYVDISDDLTVFGGPSLAHLPPTREAYDTALRTVGKTQYQAGYLPYALIEGYQLLVKDFAAVRVAAAGEKFAKDRGERARMTAQRQRREAIALHDIGIWSHFVGDASMPLHVSIHFNGWEIGRKDGICDPAQRERNPEGFTCAPVHGPWESGFVHANLATLSARVRAEAKAAFDCPSDIHACAAAYLGASQAQVTAFYRLEKVGAFRDTDARGVDFTATQLARGATALRGLIERAWTDSAAATVGWPAVPVSDIEAGKTAPPHD